MPELPEVETIARTLAPFVEGKCIEKISVLHAGTWHGEISPHIFSSQNFCIQKTSRRGKLLLLQLKAASDSCTQTDTSIFAIAFHLKMTGRLMVYPKETPPLKHTRVVIDLTDGGRLFFDDTRKFGYVRVLSNSGVLDWNFWQNLGPEPLLITKHEFVKLFYLKKANIKSLLLNQHVIAGIGNIYADESLFRAGINPHARAAMLNMEQLERLHDKIVDVLQESIAACGSSIRDYRTAHGDAGSFQNTFYVYGRVGKPCRVCGTVLCKNKIAGRTTVYCPICQI